MSEKSDFSYDLDLYPVKVLDNKTIAKEVFLLSYTRQHAFVAGQVVGVSLVKGAEPRLYSIASGTQEEAVSLLYNIKPDGAVSPSLAALKPGDTIFVSAPFGSFYGTADPAVLIASGTGIAPFVSMLRSGLHRNKMLIHGGRFLESFYFKDELNSILGRENYIRCCSQEKGEGVYEGRLTRYLEERDDLPNDRKYYLCGLAEMVVQTRDLLIDKGIPYENIVAEIYF